MNVEQLLLPATEIACEDWQLGAKIKRELLPSAIAFVFCAQMEKSEHIAPGLTTSYREELYRLSADDFDFLLCDLGDIIPGKTQQDTQVALQHVVAHCTANHTIAVVIGGGADFSGSIFHGVASSFSSLEFLQISPTISLGLQQNPQRNFLRTLFESSHHQISRYCHMGYHRHLVDPNFVSLLDKMEFPALRLSQMLGDVSQMEPYFRTIDLAVVASDSLQDAGEGYSCFPNVNGLNSREMCAYMKEIGLSQKLKAVGITNWDWQKNTAVKRQLLSQMLWYLLEGIHIQRSHPKQKSFETYLVELEKEVYYFFRDSFCDLWYFSSQPDKHTAIACSKNDYKQAVQGALSPYLFKHLSS